MAGITAGCFLKRRDVYSVDRPDMGLPDCPGVGTSMGQHVVAANVASSSLGHFLAIRLDRRRGTLWAQQMSDGRLVHTFLIVPCPQGSKGHKLIKRSVSIH